MSDESQVSSESNESNAMQTVNGKEFKFFFKTEKLLDAEGNEVGKGRKHPDVSAVLPVPQVEEIIAALSEDGPVKQYILDTVYDSIALAARMQINNWREQNPEGTFTSTLFDLAKLTLQAIALTPKKERGGWTPQEQDIKDFCDDYTLVMVHNVGYDPKKVGTHVKNFQKGLMKIKNDKPILEKVKELLTVWASRTEALEDNTQIYDWFVARIDKWLKAEEKSTIDAF